MAEWAYRALAQDGSVTRGVLKASSEHQFEERVRALGVILLDYENRAVKLASHRVRGRVGVRTIIDFTHQLSMLFRSGVPLVVGIGDMIADIDDVNFRPIVEDVHDRVTNGERLSNALARYPKVFPEDYVQVVVSGEESGAIDTSLDRLAANMEWRLATKRRIRSAFAYPAVLSLAVTGLLVLVVTWLIPRLSSIFTSAGMELPALTRATLTFSEELKAHGGVALLFLAGLVVGWNAYRRTAPGRLSTDALLLRLPLVGNLLRLIEAAQFSSLLGLLLNSGVHLVRSLEIARDAARNHVTKKNIDRIRNRVLQGGTLSDALREVGGFPSLVLRMVGIGEQSGSLVASFDRISDFFDREIPRRVERFLGVLQPALTLAMGAAVAFAVFSAFLPMTKLLGAMRG